MNSLNRDSARFLKGNVELPRAGLYDTLYTNECFTVSLTMDRFMERGLNHAIYLSLSIAVRCYVVGSG